ncbi:MAG TPA: hypothetical protein VMT85_25010 [Thermoanaerobaculia bacterium]|nr:hypothetical protein [Thermoanaerobaculia bacterium]
MSRQTSRPAALLAIVAVATLLCTPNLRADGGAETPEALFSSARIAIAEGDIAGMLSHLAPSQRKGAALMMFVGATFAIAFDDNAAALDKGLEKILEKHGLESLLEDDAGPGLDADEDALQRAGAELFAGKDEVAFIRDLFGFLADNKVMDMKKTVDVDAPLADLKVEGDRATATWGGEPFLMVREGGRWYLDQAFSR